MALWIPPPRGEQGQRDYNVGTVHKGVTGLVQSRKWSGPSSGSYWAGQGKARQKRGQGNLDWQQVPLEVLDGILDFLAGIQKATLEVLASILEMLTDVLVDVEVPRDLEMQRREE